MEYTSTTLVNMTEFAQAVGLTRRYVSVLCKQGIIPCFGKNPVRIPYEAACAALVRYAERTAAEGAANAK